MGGYALEVSDQELDRYRLMAARARATESELWQRAGIAPGAVVADVGCGPAAVTVVMAEAVGSAGRVIGVEQDATALEVARRVVAQAGAANVELREGTATHTGIASGSLDVAVMRHVLAHNGPDEAAIVAHLTALVRPGCCVYLVDIDGSATRMLDLDPDLDDLDDKYISFHRRKGNDLLPGLRLGKHLHASGLELLAYVGQYTILEAPKGMRPPAWAARQAMLEAGVATAQDIARWDAAFLRLNEQELRPTLFFPSFIAIGRRPAGRAPTTT
ncbi:MAG: hypothetical protein NVS3B26_16390 [Mycobacteriales bacterium]